MVSGVQGLVHRSEPPWALGHKPFDGEKDVLGRE